MIQPRFNIADFVQKEETYPSPRLEVRLDDDLMCCIYFDQEYKDADKLFRYLTQIHLHKQLNSPKVEEDKEQYRWKLMNVDGKELGKWQEIYTEAAYTLIRHENRKRYKGLLIIGGKEIRFPN